MNNYEKLLEIASDYICECSSEPLGYRCPGCIASGALNEIESIARDALSECEVRR